MATTEQEREVRAGQFAAQARKNEETRLLEDERWHLVQRILATPRFHRADQLRKILLHTSKMAILHPNDSVREYEIACEVLGRRADFDPTSDTIVRVQISHLRRKLEQYFSDEGSAERIRLSIPRGSYAASFEEVKFLPQVGETGAEHAAGTPLAEGALPESAAGHGQGIDPVTAHPGGDSRWSRRELILLGCLAASIAVGIVGWVARSRHAAAQPTAANVTAANPFLKPLLDNHKAISLVLPDISLMTIQTMLHQNLSVPDYLTDFPQQQLNAVSDPDLRRTLAFLSNRRTTSFNEALVAMRFNEYFSRAGSPVDTRFARDLHVTDMGEGNIILLGSSRANPWDNLFTDKTNFRLLQDPNSSNFSFVNARPLPGEQSQYSPDYHEDKQVVAYADIALVPNLNNTGFVLMISGSDVQATEGAARFMLRDHLPPQVQALFSGKDVQSYEVFLRGTHIHTEALDDFDVVAVR